MDIGVKIAELRKSRNISQQELADHLFVSRDLVSKWELGKRRPDYETIERIALYFNVSPDLILSRDDEIFNELSSCLEDGCSVSDDMLTALISEFLNKNSRLDSTVFIERYYHLKRISEISDIFKIKENHVRSLLSRTRRRLRKYIKENSK
ncbi:MAG: helix-turn-helix domain-containing protein [Clostridia bacterium]|nr:helix-turn-helix domain-containing protein [Clostridia bacterium]